jgi:ABC-type cobalamin/Fe3+-siderophores transport system ATPase subunit
MSSDAKSTLTDEAGQPKANSLGYRSTWIKMSEPSIEALRQAFLDWRSRIRLDRDPRIVGYDRIHSLLVQNVAFLEDQEVVLSPSLNCLIGGRGSGKSSLFEYIRFALRRENDDSAAEQISRIRKTLKPDSLLRLTWKERDDSRGAPGPEDTFEYRTSAGRSQVVSREVIDASTIFQGLGIQMFSQREVTKVAGSPDFLLRLIDNLVGARLKNLRQEEEELKERIKGLQGQEESLERLRAEVGSLEQEVQELERRWAARSAVQEEQRRHRAAQEAQRYLGGVTDRANSLVGELERLGADLVESHSPLGSVTKSWPESAFFETLDVDVERAKQQLAEDIRQAAERYRTRIRELTAQSPVQAAVAKAEQEFREACARQGLRPEDLEQLLQLDQQRKVKMLELESKRNRAAEIGRTIQGLKDVRSSLLELWRKQTLVRTEEIARILQSEAIPQVPRRDGDRITGKGPTLEVPIQFQSDRADFFRHWSELAPDARTRVGRQWDELGDKAFDKFLSTDLGSPWTVIQTWLERDSEFPATADVLEALREHLLAKRRDQWNNAQLARIQDGVDLILYRSDGTEAGSLRQNELSDGQRNTAILMLLLASGDGPILIDQPEDELDSGFIFQQLVPLLREIKNQRQVIVVTHNPNLPVNADAELIYALQAQAVEETARGVVLAQGGLDRETVKNAVLEIMEGSQEAFLRRREKYHF